MGYISRTALAYFNDIELLEVILEDDERANKRPFRNVNYERIGCVDNALISAHSVLPDGKGKRALEYVIKHPCAEFHFGGSDAVGPAIREGLKILKKQRLTAEIENYDPKLYRVTA